MILNALRKPPVISFGLSMTMLSCSPDQLVTVYCNDIYNENEFNIIQDVVPISITINFISLADPETILTEIYEIGGTYLGRNFYFNIGGVGGATTFIFFDGEKWLNVTGFVPDGTFITLIGELNNDLLYPEGAWTAGSANFFILNSFANINNQGFTFPATESREIEIEIRNKRTGELMKSNKIQLIVEPPSS
jgi:hypothetical protein